MEIDRVVPEPFTTIARTLDEVANAVSDYFDADDGPNSVAARERAREADFAELPRTNPGADATMQAKLYLSTAVDHLHACAGVIRTPGTAISFNTVLRTQLVASALAVEMSDPNIKAERRMQLWVNAYLDSQTEQMRLVGSVAPEFTQLNAKRKDMADGARRLGWTVNRPSPEAAWPKDWWVGSAKPTSETMILERVMPLASKAGMGTAIYRTLCATTHVRMHGLTLFMDRDNVTSLGDGIARTSIVLRADRVAMFSMTAAFAFDAAMTNATAFYDWPPEPWKRVLSSSLTTFRSFLGA